MLLNLIRAAAEYDLILTLFTSLADVVSGWQSAYSQIATDFPHLAPLLTPWQNRADQTQRLLTQLAAQAQHEVRPDQS